MKTLSLILTAIIIISTACNQQKKVTISPEKPQAGDVVQIIYNPVDSLSMEATKITLEYSIFSIQCTEVMHIEDTRAVEMQWDNNSWTAAVPTNPSTDIVAIKFLPDNTKPDNNGGEGYFIRTYDKQGSETTDSKFAYAASYVKWATFKQYVNYDKKKAAELMSELFELYPFKKGEYIADWLSALLGSIPDSIKSEVFSREINETISYDNISDDDYAYLIWFCESQDLKDRIPEIEKMALQKYPNGKVAYNKKFEAFNKEPDIIKQMQMARELELDIPGRWELSASAVVFTNLIQQEKYDMLAAWWDTIQSEFTLSPVVYGFLAGNLLDSKHEIDLALDILNNGKEAWQRERTKSYTAKLSFISDQEKSILNDRDQSNMLMTWAKVLRLSGRNAEAQKKYEESFSMYPLIKAQEGDIVAYTELLRETKMYANASPFLEEVKRSGIEVPGINDILKEIWINKNGNEIGFENYLAELEAEGVKESLEKQKKLMINQPAPDFTLTDLEGNIIKLSDYRGKVVVLDFWATWCGPCKASFPAMQKAVNKYAQDDNVVFFFINTREIGRDKKENALKFLEESGYSFHVLLDLDNKVDEAFGVTAIPTKLVIDAKGKIRFNVVGITGSTEEMVQELVGMITLVQKRSN